MNERWQNFQRYYTEFPTIKLSLDLSRIDFSKGYFASMEQRLKNAVAAMTALEAGAIANPDEKRMVGHYWLRNPALAPTLELRKEIEEAQNSIKEFVTSIHNHTLRGKSGPFRNILLIGIGGSALGPQLVSDALGNNKRDKLKFYCLDNTDPDGFDRILSTLAGELGHTLCIVISKSGKTIETKNGVFEVELAYAKAGILFCSHAVAITETNSDLHTYALKNHWLKSFPIWNWVGGRTSEFSTVGLLPAALQGIDIDLLISGACTCDVATRTDNVKNNPALQLALSWFFMGNGKGQRNMIILPYKDRLSLLSKYLQQLIMESIGKRNSLNGLCVNQGLTVFGNRGSTDQHSYIQQLIDGTNSFFVTFIEVLKDRDGISPLNNENTTAGDYLNAFFIGTRNALHENGRRSISITINDISPFSIGVLIALFERAVGFYATLIGVNAYNQPGVEAGKKAAEYLIRLQQAIVLLLESEPYVFLNATDIAKRIGEMDYVEEVFKICLHLGSNEERKIVVRHGNSPTETFFSWSK
jgi:glucose-6-phosphate isomerase